MQSEDNISMNTLPSPIKSWKAGETNDIGKRIDLLSDSLTFSSNIPILATFSTLHFVYQWFIYFHFQLFLISYINLFSLFTWYIFLFLKIIWVSWISMKHLVIFPFKINEI